MAISQNKVASPTQGFCLAGIGKALAMRLADQGINVVLVAKPDNLLDETYAEMQSIYKNQQVRKASLVINTPFQRHVSVFLLRVTCR